MIPSEELAEDREARPLGREMTAGLLARYDRPGPRYTSYPTAVELSDDFTRAHYEERLAELATRPGDPLAIYVHLPFCEKRCDFCGCNVIATRRRDMVRSYLTLLEREIDLLYQRLPGRGFAQLHLGGGTPTYFFPDELAAMLEHLLSRFTSLPGSEMAIEVDPRVTTREHLEILAELGFNRLSLGVQDLAPKVQRTISRHQTAEQTQTMLEHGRRLGFGSVNADLIYGLPHQDAESFARTVAWLVERRIDRVAVYSFAYVPWIHPQQKRIDENALPSRDEKLDLFSLARELFLDAGYETIGMDHFARPDDELAIAKRDGRLRRNFQGYTVLPAMDVLGFGISAIGDVSQALVQNHKKLSRYRQDVEADRLPVARGFHRSADDRLRAEVIHALMCNFAVDVPAIEDRHNLHFADYFSDELARLDEHARKGMIRVAPDRLEVTPMGELFVRNLAMCFDRHWWQKHQKAQQQVFSRTI